MHSLRAAALLLSCAAALQAQPSSLERQAYRAYQARDWAMAARLYEDFHASAAGTASSYDNLGVALTNLGRWSQAEAALRKALELNPQHRWAYNHLGFVYREQGRYEEAIQMFRRQIEISPKDPYAYRNLAGALALLGRLDDADQIAATHEQYTYEQGSVYIDIACNLNSRNQPENARKYLEKAEAAGVERTLLAQESAHYFLTLRDYRRAEEQYLKLLDYRPNDPVVAMRLAMLYFQTGNLDKSAAAFARVITVDGADRVTIRTSANTSKTVALAELRNNPTAGSTVLGDLPLDLSRAAMLVRLDSYRRLYMESSSAENLARLRAAYEEFLARERGAEVEAWGREALGWMLFEAGQVETARAELERAYARAPHRRMIAYHLAAALERSSEKERALALYTRSLKPLPENSIDCGCEQPDLAAREKIARALYVKVRGEATGFDAYRRGIE